MNIPDELKRFDPGPAQESEEQPQETAADESTGTAEAAEEGQGALAD